MTNGDVPLTQIPTIHRDPPGGYHDFLLYFPFVSVGLSLSSTTQQQSQEFYNLRRKNIFYRTLTRCDSRTLHINKPRNFFFTSHPKQITPGLDPPFKKAYQLPRRHRRRHPSWNCACGNGASCCHPSSHCAWPNAWTPSSCRPSWRTPCGARNVSWAPWFNRLKTTGSKQLRAGHSGETTQNTE